MSSHDFLKFLAAWIFRLPPVLVMFYLGYKAGMTPGQSALITIFSMFMMRLSYYVETK